ncbi:hypothetical protein T440DRAFT_113031 [Plenodomus tracheiphilus IPT5]|uniref:Aflatoxin regulatory protein domain-containing protein n=1 Tax=Plenodomus tracheiphilus IPT5 TaxID=1408161 RepID=A0A6A7B3Z6_9PLEO|nr:hypothetical protein T440DRAFT_113031 [Plenodomus tracheiphilus IPT5]
MTAFADAVSVDANQDIAPTVTTGSVPDIIGAAMYTGTEGLAIASMEHNRPEMEPWLMPFARNDTQSATDWSHFGPVDMDTASGSLVSYPGHSPTRMFPDTQPNLHRPLTTDAPSNHAYIHSEPDSMQPKSDDTKLKPHESKLDDAGDNGKTMVTVGQLAQLTMRLSSLRHMSSNLARTATTSSSGTTEVPRTSLVDSTAFESVAAWLARDELAGNTTDPIPIEYPQDPQCATTPSSGQHILNEAFSASHLLLDMLRNLQAEQADRQTNMMLGAMMTPSPTAGHGYFDILSGLGVGVLNGGEAMMAQARSHASIRHLVMVCNTLILEVYLAILLALQHDAYLSIHENKVMKSVRMVLLVQLCSHLIDRQCQALDSYLSSLQPPSSLNEGYLNVDRNALNHLRRQIQERLHQLRQMLRCST